MSTKPKVIKSIFTAILGILVFGLIFLLSVLIFGGIIYLLAQIPIIGKLVDIFFYMRGDSPDLMLAVLSPSLAYYLTKGLLSVLNKDLPSLSLSCSIAGMFIVIIHVLSLIFNLILKNSILFNIAQGIAGLVLFIHGKEIKDEIKDAESNTFV